MINFISRKKLVASLFLLFLAGCASTANPKFSVGRNLEFSNEYGVIIGKSIYDSSHGATLTFHNLNTNQFIKTSAGISYPTESNYFMLNVPVGTYRISGVGAYNGAVGPVGEAFVFHVKSRSINYIGTFLQPQFVRASQYGGATFVRAKIYARLVCPGVLGFSGMGCNGSSPEASTDAVIQEHFSMPIYQFNDFKDNRSAMELEFPALKGLEVTEELAQ